MIEVEYQDIERALNDSERLICSRRPAQRLVGDCYFICCTEVERGGDQKIMHATMNEKEFTRLKTRPNQGVIQNA